MKYHAQFLVQYTPDGEIQELLGSDGVFILDGRNRFGTMVKDAVKRIDFLKNVQPKIVGFKIMQGSRFGDCTEIHKWLIRKEI